MTRASPSLAWRHDGLPAPSVAPFTPLPALVTRDAGVPEAANARRTRLWEFNANLHCSIIGTCLSTGELRQTLAKLGLAAADASDHDLHSAAVTLAGRHDAAGKRLHKALDARHRLAINRFARLAAEAQVRAAWRDCVRQGDIPGAYWATLTHPATTPALIRDAFGEVHMLSHLVGAANRADIRRLSVLEQERADLQARLDRQQAQLRDAVVARDAEIRDLRQALAGRLADADQATNPATILDETLRQLVADLERRLGAETGRRIGVERRLGELQRQAAEAQAARSAADREAAQLRDELRSLEAVLEGSHDGDGTTQGPRLEGFAVLYVGGRPGEIPRLRAIGERLGATLLHHDGGVEESSDRLAALVSRADLVMFPVDCVSHPAALAAKRLCRHGGKRFVPLRSAGAASFLAALCRQDVAEAYRAKFVTA